MYQCFHCAIFMHVHVFIYLLYGKLRCRRWDCLCWSLNKIERKTMIRNRYNYPTPSIRDIKGKETQTRNNWNLMETSLAESQTDSYFPTKWPNGYPKQKDVSDTHIQRRTITKINYDRRTALERSVKSISLGALNRFYMATILALTSAAV